MKSQEEDEIISVVIPTYYRNDALRRALQSVYEQNYDSIEILVVDDSGEAHGKPVVNEFDNITYIQKDQNEGPQIARTIGIERSHGKYVQLLDDDDRLHEEKFQKQVRKLKRSTDVGVVYSGFSWENGYTALPKKDVRGDVLDRALMFDTAPCITSTMLTEREVLDQILPLKDRTGADDTGLKIELAKITEFEYIDEALVYRTESPDSRGNSLGKLQGQKEILNEFRGLYREFPPSVYQTALAKTYLVECMLLLDEKLWSSDAILASGKAFYHSPEKSIPYVGVFIASLFGRPGRNIGLSIFQLIRGKSRRGKSV